MNKKKTVLMTLLFSLIIGLIILIVNKMYPFGNNTIFMFDLKNQYIAFYKMLRNIIIDNGSFLYSFNIGFGTPLIQIISYYLLNPISILLLFDSITMIRIINILLVVLIPTLSSVSMSYYLSEKNNKYVIPLSLLYGYSAYLFAYSTNYMWTIEMSLLPLITLGVERLFKDKKSIVYFISLMLSLLINYYIGYMLCIYSVIYFLLYLFIYRKNIDNIKNKIFIFIKYSLLAGLLCSFIFVPLSYYLFNNSESIGLNLFNSNISYNIFELISSLFTGARITLNEGDLVGTLPNIGSSIIVLVLLVSFVFNKKINKNDKRMYLILLSIYVLFTSISYFDYVLHAFHYPIGFPFRYAFIITFLLIKISTISIDKLDLDKKSYVTLGIIIVVLTLTMSINSVISYYVLFINLGIIVLYCLLFKLDENVKYIISAVMIIEIIINSTSSMPHVNNYKETIKNINNTTSILNKIDDNSFYRVASVNKTTHNDGALYNYNSIDSFYSGNNYDVIRLNDSLGISNNLVHMVKYYGDNDIYNALFDVKYTIYENDVKENNTLGLIYYVEDEIKTYKVSDNIIDNYNNLIYKMSYIDNIIVPVYPSKSVNNNEISYELDGETIIIGTKGYSHIYTEDGNYQVKDNMICKDDISMCETIEKMVITNSKTIKVKYEDKDYKEVLFYKINKDKLNEFINRIEKVDYKVDNNITINIDNNSNRLLFTSIPYDEGFSIYLDGNKIDKIKLVDTFIGIDVPEGKHSITIHYDLPLKKEGSYITIVLLLIISSYYIYINRHNDYK